MSTATIPTASDLEISYEGPGEFAELVGGDQGNFLVRRPGYAAREVGVVLNHQASAALAAELGHENSEEFRLGLVRIVGRAAIEQLYLKSNRIDGLMTVSAASLREEPELLAAARAALASMPKPAPIVVETTHDGDSHDAAAHH
jgi:hypothetical protein